MYKIITLVVIFLLVVACTGVVKNNKKASANFKGGVFVNTHPVKFHSLWEMLWAGLTSDTKRAIWPDWLEETTDKKPMAVVNSNDIRVTYINHATFLIQTAGFNILTDPVFSERTSPVSFLGPKRIHQPGISLNNLPKIDLIIISHDHYDHLDLPSINALIERDNPKVFMGLGVSKHLDNIKNTVELDWWESATISENFKLWFLDVQHFSGRTLTDRNTTLWGGFLLQINDQNIYFGGDSGYADHYKRTYEKFGAMDLAFLPIGAYAPREFFKPIHLNPSEAVQAHVDLQSKLSIAMHYGTFQLSAEPYSEPTELLKQAKAEANIPPSSFITLNIGQPKNISTGVE